MDSLWQDIRYALRMLARSPGFTIVAVLTLALGIGANTAIFTVVNAVLMRSLSYPEADRLVAVYWVAANKKGGARRYNPSLPDALDYQEQSGAFAFMVPYGRGRFGLTGDSEAEVVDGLAVPADFFPTLGLEPHTGRVFSPEEERPSGEEVVLLSYEYWQSRFGGDPEAVGQTLRVNGRPRTIVGVIEPPLGSIERGYSLYVPWGATEDQSYASRGSSGPPVIARMKAGVSLEQAEAELNTIARRLAAEYPDTNKDRGVELVSLHDRVVRSARSTLYLLLGAVGFILLIACANVANLLLARASGRGKEMAIRAAVGARRARLVRQMLTESLLLSFLGGLSGLLLGTAGVEALVALRPPRIPRLDEVGVDSTVLLFTVGAAVLTGLIFGLVPALSATRTNLTEGLKEGRSRGPAGGGGKLKNTLVVAEVSLALVLLLGAGLMMKSFLLLQQVDPGIRLDNLLTFRVTQFEMRYPSPASRHAFLREAVDRLEKLAGVESVAVVTLLPLGGSSTVTSVGLGDRKPTDNEGWRSGDVLWISPGYFDTLSIPLLRGRMFTHQDDVFAPQVAVVDKGLANAYWPGENPLGKRLFVSFESAPREVVGVVGNVRYDSLEAERRPKIYIPYLQSPQGYWSYIIRSKQDPMALVGAAKARIWELDPQLAVHDVRTMKDLFSQWLIRPRFYLVLFGIFASLAATMAALGIYGVISYSVSRRTHEIGVRMALGAQRGNILGMVLREGMGMVAVGVAVGLLASYWLTRFLQSFLFEVTPTDPATFAAVSILLTIVALLACCVPARRATQVDPMTALRYE